MFCDLIGSTSLSEKLDPEDLRDVTSNYQESCSQVIRRFDGYIASYHGDGIRVYFGYPIAHEDDAARAVRAGLGIVEAISRLNVHLEDRLRVQLGLRIGVHTGLVVVDQIGTGNQRRLDIFGETPNIAARMQTLAEDNSLVISAATHRLIEGYFDCADLGPQIVKGLTKPMVVYKVNHESGARSRFDITTSAGLTPLVGRERETETMFEAWKNIQRGQAQTILLGAEPGLGKSRLLLALKEHVARNPKAWLTECRSSPYHQNTSLYPIIEALENVALQFTPADTADDKLAKLEGFLVQYGMSLPETLPLFASMLSIPINSHYSNPTLAPAKQKQVFIDALINILLARAADQPFLFVMEDLHWADASSLELLEMLVQRNHNSRMLIVLTFRPEFVPTFITDTSLINIILNRLSRDQTEKMVANMTIGKPLPSEVVREIVTKTDGVPLFIEELTTMVRETGLVLEKADRYELAHSGPRASLAIPTTLNSALMARLDKLSPLKLVAQIASTLGREFQYEFLRHIAPVDESQLRRSLTQLVDSEILFQRGVLPQANYIFKHALIQEAAYESLLKSNRQLYHGRAVEVLEEEYPVLVATQPEILAHHCSEAGMVSKAVGYWLVAGQQAFARSANKEAVSQVERGLKLLPLLEKTAALQMELPLQVTHGMALICIKGYSSNDVEQTFARAREICSEMRGTPQIAPVIWGLWAFYIVRGEFRKAIETGNELNQLAETSGDRNLIVECQPVLGHNYYWTGDFLNAEKHFRRGVELYNSEIHRSHAAAFGQDPGVVCMAYEGWLLWQMGDAEKAVTMSLDAIALAKQISHVYSEAYATVFAGVLYMMMHEPKRCLELARRSATLADEYGFPIWSADSLMLSGWAKAQMGSPDEGIAELSQGIAAWKAIGARLWLTQPLGLLAEIYGRIGDFDKAFSRLSEAFTIMENTGERHFHSELLRIKGILLLQRNMKGNTLKDDAELSFRKAVTIAHYANAKMFELYARIELVKLLEGACKSDTDKKELADLYDSVPSAAKQLQMKEAVESIT